MIRLGIFVTSYFSAAEHKRVDMITKIFQRTGYDEFENCHYRRTCLYSYRSQHSKHAAYKGSSSKCTHRHARIRVKSSLNWLCDKIKYLNRINLHCSCWSNETLFKLTVCVLCVFASVISHSSPVFLCRVWIKNPPFTSSSKVAV